LKLLKTAAMKKRSLIIGGILLFTIISSFTYVNGQDKTKEEIDKDLKIQEEIDLQKKALMEQKAAQDELQKALIESQKKVDQAMKEVEAKVNGDNLRGPVRVFSGQRGGRSFEFDDPFLISPSDIKGYNHSMGEGERSSWDFSKSVKESTFSREYVFDVEKSSKTVVMSVNGDCKTGEIRIKIIMPNGKTYSDIVVDEFGNLNWRKSFNISEEENKDKAGAWKYEISAAKATGFFKISLQTF
jgi:hypothetical protein